MHRRLWGAVLPAIAIAALAMAGGARAVDCVLNTNPACSGAINLGNIAGDAASTGIARSGIGEAFFRVNIRENSSSARALNARVTLSVPPDTDYDLIVRCASCTGSVVQTSKNGMGAAEIVNVTRADNFNDNSFWIVIEVRHYAGTGCGAWQLTINGNTPAAQGALSCP